MKRCLKRSEIVIFSSPTIAMASEATRPPGLSFPEGQPTTITPMKKLTNQSPQKDQETDCTKEVPEYNMEESDQQTSVAEDDVPKETEEELNFTVGPVRVAPGVKGLPGFEDINAKCP